jgi:hypothetical protein
LDNLEIPVHVVEKQHRKREKSRSNAVKNTLLALSQAISRRLTGIYLFEQTVVRQLAKDFHEHRDADFDLLSHQPPPGDSLNRVHGVRMLLEVVQDRFSYLFLVHIGMVLRRPPIAFADCKPGKVQAR